MIGLVRLSMALIVAAAAARATPEAPGPACRALEGDSILARDLAEALPAFATVPPDTRIGYAPMPGVRRVYRAAELRRLAIRYNVPLASASEICFERAMEALRPERVADAMRQALDNPHARIEITELSRYPVPRGEIQFKLSALQSTSVPSNAIAGSGAPVLPSHAAPVLPSHAAPVLPGNAAPVLWRGFVGYGGERRFAIWARARIVVRSGKIVAAEGLPAGHPIEARQLRLEEVDEPPSSRPVSLPLDQITGKIPRRPIAAGDVITANRIEDPKDVERGEVVHVEVLSGGARLDLEGRAQADGRKGDMIPVRNMATGKRFSARIADKGRVVLTASLPSTVKDGNK
jgi:flagella basal body P-ring formation protein FlgA